MIENDGKKSIPQKLVRLGETRSSLFRSGDDAWAATSDGTVRVASTDYQRWLTTAAYEQLGVVPSGGNVDSAVTILHAKAMRTESIPLYKRVAREGEVIYLDLHDYCVQVTADGWELLDEAPVKFRRPQNSAPIPAPIRGFNLDDFRDVFFLSEDQWTLLLGWLLDTLKGYGPYLACIIAGEHGCCKTFLSVWLKTLVDPVVKANTETTAMPRNEEEFALFADKCHVMAFDNISAIAPRQSDILCRIATGGGVQVRKLYTNDDLVIFDAVNPIIVNGIPDLADAGDLNDRAISVHLEKIKDADRRAAKELHERLKEMWPGVLGALLDYLVAGLAHYPTTNIELSRMADSTKWIAACGLSAFAAAYKANKQETSQIAVEGSNLALALIDLLDWEPPVPLVQLPDGFEPGLAFQGSYLELLNLLPNVYPGVGLSRDWKWAQSPKALSNELRRVAPSLRSAGVVVEFGKTHGKRWVQLSKRGTVGTVGGTVENTTVPPVSPYAVGV